MRGYDAFLKRVRKVCTCGLHGKGVEVDDTPEMWEKIESCPAYQLTGPPEAREDWFRKHGIEENAS